jgi:hypothetical protein
MVLVLRADERGAVRGVRIRTALAFNGAGVPAPCWPPRSFLQRDILLDGARRRQVASGEPRYAHSRVRQRELPLYRCCQSRNLPRRLSSAAGLTLMSERIVTCRRPVSPLVLGRRWGRSPSAPVSTSHSRRPRCSWGVMRTLEPRGLGLVGGFCSPPRLHFSKTHLPRPRAAHRCRRRSRRQKGR